MTVLENGYFNLTIDVFLSAFIFLISSVVIANLMFPLTRLVSNILHSVFFVKNSDEKPNSVIWNIACVVSFFFIPCVLMFIIRLGSEFFETNLQDLKKYAMDNPLMGTAKVYITKILTPILAFVTHDPNYVIEAIYEQFNYFVSAILPTTLVKRGPMTVGYILDTFHTCILILLAFVSSIHILRGWYNWGGQVKKIGTLDAFYHSGPRIYKFYEIFEEGLKNWVIGQTIVSICLSIYYALFFSVIKIKGSLIIGILFGFASFVPYIGDLLSSCILGYSLCLMEPSLMIIGLVILILVIGHIAGSHILVPLIIGSHTNLSPIQIILGFVVYPRIFGVLGLFLNVPLCIFFTAIIKAMFVNKDDL